MMIHSPVDLKRRQPLKPAVLEPQSGHPSLARLADRNPHFGGATNSGLSAYRKLLNRMDYRSFGSSYLSQIQVIYAGCIGWRLVAANERRKDSPTKSWNEVRENALRDSMGYLFWFFATPMLQRATLAYVTKKHDPSIGNSLYRVNQDVANGKGLMGKLKAWNPLYRVDIPSSKQVEDQQKQALAHLEKGTEAYQKAEAYYKKLFKYRNIATALGLINTIALIGIGINLLNFYLTRKNMERRKAEFQRPVFPNPPGLPKPSAPSVQNATTAQAVAPAAAATTASSPPNQTATTGPSAYANPWALQPQTPQAS